MTFLEQLAVECDDRLNELQGEVAAFAWRLRDLSDQLDAHEREIVQVYALRAIIAE